jgi:4-hydroxybenzoate polyprenyltransferase
MLKQTLKLLITYRAYHAMVYVLHALVVASLTHTPFHGIDYFNIVLASVSIYIWNTFLDTREDSINRTENDQGFLTRHARKGMATGAAGFAAVLAISTWQGSIEAFLCMFYVMLAAFFYSQSYIGEPLKRVFLLKNAIAIAAWICLSVLYPLFNNKPGFTLADFTLAHWASAVWILTFFVVGEIMSDIKDMKGDAEAGGVTIPIMFGAGGALSITAFASLPALFWIGSHILAGNLGPWFWFMAFGPAAMNLVFILSYFLVRNPEYCIVRNVNLQDRIVYLYLVILVMVAWLTNGVGVPPA